MTRGRTPKPDSRRRILRVRVDADTEARVKAIVDGKPGMSVSALCDLALRQWLAARDVR